ncbi:MAG: hypothetical protein ISR69_05910 [Gammaproteobacteria bacterium]|nr:hypothetical protein [Gammaproteobacteria bacterium]
MHRVVFLLLLIAATTASKGSSTSYPYIDANNIEMHQNDVNIKLNDDGSIKSIISIVSVALIHIDEKSIKEALITADILAKVNLSRYFHQEVSSTKNRSAIFNKAEYAQNYITSIKKSSNYLLKGASVINKTVNKEKKYVSITIEISDYNMQFVNKAKSILGIKEVQPSKEFESHIKSLNVVSGVRVVNFNDNNYITSLAIKKIKGITMSSRLDAYLVARDQARVNLSKFINGEKINHRSIRTIEDIKATKHSQSKEINKIVETFNKENSGTYSRRMKAVGFNSLKYIDNGKMFYYLYLKIPKN